LLNAIFTAIPPLVMSLSKFLTIFCALLAVPVVGNASVTIAIATSGWGNNTTASVNGMTWGFVVSSDGSAFNGTTTTTLSSALQGFSIPLTATPSNPVQIGSSIYYFVEAQLPTTNSGPPSFTNGFMNTDNFNLAGPVGSGDPLGLLWFAEGTTTSGSHYGFQNLNFNTPADGSNIIAGTVTSTPGLAAFTIGAAPEPGHSLLALLGVGTLVLRRRRK